MSSREACAHIPDWSFDDEFDGGDETCGRVIVNLHLYIKDQAPGSRILVISETLERQWNFLRGAE